MAFRTRTNADVDMPYTQEGGHNGELSAIKLCTPSQSYFDPDCIPNQLLVEGAAGFDDFITLLGDSRGLSIIAPVASIKYLASLC
jgi:hypothetical protein